MGNRVAGYLRESPLIVLSHGHNDLQQTAWKCWLLVWLSQRRSWTCQAWCIWWCKLSTIQSVHVCLLVMHLWILGWHRMTQQQIKELQCVALADYHKGLITRTQLLNIVHTLDRKSFIKQWHTISTLLWSVGLYFWLLFASCSASSCTQLSSLVFFLLSCVLTSWTQPSVLTGAKYLQLLMTRGFN